MKNLFLPTILALLLSSCGNNTPQAPISLNIANPEVEYYALINDVTDSANGTSGNSYSRNWIFKCSGTTPEMKGVAFPGYVYIASNFGSYGGFAVDRNSSTILLSRDSNPPPLLPPQMIYVESVNQIDLPYIIASCISGTLVPRPGVFVRVSYQSSGGTVNRDIGTRVFPSLKSVSLDSGGFSF